MSDPSEGAPQGAGQPSEEEIRAYLSQLREAPVEQVLADSLSALLNAAQVKVGRADARLLLDLAASMMDQGRDHLPEELTGQVDDVIAQLRVAQVEAEKELAGAGEATGGTGPAESGSTTPPDEGPSDPSSRLWVPGS